MIPGLVDQDACQPDDSGAPRKRDGQAQRTSPRAREAGRRIDDLRRLGAVFGTHLIVEHDDNVARAIGEAARRSRTTHIVMGVPHLHQRFGKP